MSAMIPAGHDGQWTQFSLHAVSVTMIISMTDSSSIMEQSVGNARVPSRGHVLITSVFT